MPSANKSIEADGGAGSKPGDGKKGKRKSKSSNYSQETGGGAGKNLVNELKLFQNSNLLNQQDPLEQLHQQINQLIQDDDVSHSRFLSPKVKAPSKKPPHGVASSPLEQPTHPPHTELNLASQKQQQSLSTPSMIQYNHLAALQLPHANTTNQHQYYQHQDTSNHHYDKGQEVFTVKKGVLWQQQNHDKFHQRLFNRWKKRYFILTTDYFVCFKRSSSRVGHSEMGKFVYKIALTEIAKIEWLRPKKNDKGPIVLCVKDRFDLLLWSKKETDDWMLLIAESVQRLKLRRDGRLPPSNGHLMSFLPTTIMPMQGDRLDQGLYENAAAPNHQNGDNDHTNATEEPNDCLSRPEIRPTIEPISSSQTKDPPRTSNGPRRPLKRSTEGESNLTESLTSSKSNPIEHEMQGDQREVEEIGSSLTPGGKALQQAEAVGETNSANFKSPSDQRQYSTRSRSSSRKVSSAENGPAANGSSKAISTTKEDNNCGIGTDKLPEDQHMGSVVGPIDSEADAAVAGAISHCAAVGAQKNAEAEFAHRATAPAGDSGAMRRRTGRLEKPTSNLIRRDDSWHSLVSLTRVGVTSTQAGPEPPLYARHIVPTNDRPNSGQASRQRANYIESTATPLRDRPPMRQHSIQSYAHRLTPIRQQQQARSFDVSSQIPNSPSLHGNQQTASHHQRLLQLQLLHNSNNVDYIRANNGECRDENQIYGPESIATTNHYGYYSMRSNLKSAASEFSFIRPSSSGFQHAQPITPLHSGLTRLEDPSRAISEQGPSGVSKSRRPLALVGQNNSYDLNNNGQSTHNYPDPNHPQHFAHPRAGELFAHASALGHRVADESLLMTQVMAPSRDLPLKPNKRREANGELLEKSSLGSSIACFFRRAFSRRSKRRPKLVESCSSSLAAFDSNLDQIQVAQSAFSTGSKSAKADRASAIQSNGQPKRMIDLIEAFANKTALDQQQHATGLQSNQQVQQQKALFANQQLDQSGSIRPKFIRDQFGSPLHKSNSISTSSGFGGLSESVIFRNQRLADENNAIIMRDRQMASPLITRSTKVMSANLTPLFSQKKPFDQTGDDGMSPRNARNLPRPSSIYGQPSLISSPVAMSVSNGRGGDSFGQHRSSVHGSGNVHRDRAPNIEFRRQRTINAPFLDTTREVAEEVSSPTSEMRDFLPRERLYDHEINARLAYNVQDSSLVRMPKNDSYYRHQRQAVVNPILQSPAMSAIYDNHRSASTRNRFNEPAQSHYDNHQHPMSYHDPDRDASGYSRPQIMIPARMDNHTSIEPLASPLIQAAGRTVQPVVTNQGAMFTPVHEAHTPRQSQLVRPTAATEMSRVSVRSKPAAIVAPTTPSRQSNYVPPEYDGHEDTPGQSSMGGFVGRPSPMRAQQTLNGAATTVVSPIASRRSINQAQLQYQQSPLVDEQTRILKRASGRVQTTIFASDQTESPKLGELGAARINLDQTSAASAQQRAKNFAAAQTSDNPSGAKSVIVSSHKLTNAGGDRRENSDRLASDNQDDVETTGKLAGLLMSGSSQDEKSSSTGSRSGISGSVRESPPSSRATISSDETEVGKLETIASGGSKSERRYAARQHSQTGSRSSAGHRRRGSSTDRSDELSSQTGSIDEPEEKDWVNSKLVQ